ncbi:MAG: hypothetical protein Q9195_003930 [Heterodermia aff. obscurata]
MGWRAVCPQRLRLSRVKSQAEAYCIILGPYAPAILRFEITFPSTYPTTPPVVRFISDVFHPLVTPLTTYTCSSIAPIPSKTNTGHVEHLPPGGFSLKHGFAHWFENLGSSTTSSTPSGDVNGSNQQRKHVRKLDMIVKPSAASTSCAAAKDSYSSTIRDRSSRLATCRITTVLDYVKKSFDDVELLDGIPLEAAGNSGAWKAWQAHRENVLDSSSEDRRMLDTQDDRQSLKTFDKDTVPQVQKQQEDWNWDGIWQERVRKGIITSISDPALYGNGVGDDPVWLCYSILNDFG